MRNFILFIRRFFNLILFLALEIVCIVLIQHTNTMQGSDIISSANAAAGLVYKKKSDVVHYFGLTRMNDSLLRENARLRQALAVYKSMDTLGDSVVSLSVPLGDTSKHLVRYSEYLYRTARVINNAVNATDNYITLDRGSADGITRNMAVLSGTGVVGLVEHVSKHYASVISVLSSKQKVSAKLMDGTNGFVTWEGKDPGTLMMTDVPAQAKVKKGDSVFTNTYSLYFPPEVLIGTVIGTERVQKNATQRIILRSSTDFRKLQYVYVVENKMSEERHNLEATSTRK